MRVLFYLPLVTPWWFEHVIEPLIRRLYPIADVHVLAPPVWRNTGISTEQLDRCLDLPRLTWQIVGPDCGSSLRYVSKDHEGLVSFVRDLAPDIVLCRTADFETARLFPGAVRFLMEAAASPFKLDPSSITITADPFHHGALPDLTDDQSARLHDLIADLWRDVRLIRETAKEDRSRTLNEAGIRSDRPLLLMPLEYEHEENFFLQHRLKPGVTNRELLLHAARLASLDFTVAVTDHPLNALHLDRSELMHQASRLHPRLVLCSKEIMGVSATLALASQAEGILLGDSKTYSLAAAFGVPLLRLSRFQSAKWLKAYENARRFVEAAKSGEAPRPSERAARLWFAYHLANEAFLPNDPGLTGQEIVDRALVPVNSDRWEAGVGRVSSIKLLATA